MPVKSTITTYLFGVKLTNKKNQNRTDHNRTLAVSNDVKTFYQREYSKKLAAALIPFLTLLLNISPLICYYS